MISDFKNIENLHKLHYLVADNNEISRIDETFANIDKLELLHLKGNMLFQNNLPAFRSRLRPIKFICRLVIECLLPGGEKIREIPG